jgi:hypothetical protein
LQNAVKSGHIKSIKKEEKPEARLERYKGLNYQLVKSSNDDFILGDAPVVFHVKGQRAYKTFLDADSELIGLYWPIDSSTLLIGTHDTKTLSLEEIRQAIARCSLEFFVSSADSERNRELQKIMGVDAELISKEEMDKVLDECLGF